MVSKALLLLLAIVAARFGCPARRTTLALACDESSTPVLQNNRYSSYYSNTNNNNNNNENENDNDYGYNNIDGIADRNDKKNNNVNGNNDNYNYNKAAAKWLLPQQKLYGNSQEQQQQQQQQFVDDPEAARNDFLSQLSDLNAAVQGVGLFGAQHSSSSSDSSSNSNNNDDNNDDDNNDDNDNNVWQAEAEFEREQGLERRSQRSSSYMNRNAGQPEMYNNEDAALPADSIDVEGEEDYAVARKDADELSAQLPYGIQNVRKRRVRSVMPPQLTAQHNSGDGVTYQSLCPTKRVTIKLDTGEYRPNHYVEVTCANNYAPLPPKLHNYEFNFRNNELPLLRALLNERIGEKREICSATGFACIQLNRTIHLIRLNEGSGCWESETRTVPSGCECMWPKHSYGDIASYHQAQKRFRTTLTNLHGRGAGANIDYTPGVGYRQLTLRNRAPKQGAGAGAGAGAAAAAVGGAGRSRRANALDYDNYDLN